MAGGPAWAVLMAPSSLLEPSEGAPLAPGIEAGKASTT